MVYYINLPGFRLEKKLKLLHKAEIRYILTVWMQLGLFLLASQFVNNIV
jgi:hypothetical protein